MKDDQIKSKSSSYRAKYSIIGAGVVQVKASEILKTQEARRQLDAVKNIKLATSKS